jgi:hypothetical protein
MAKQTLNIIKGWFITLAKPTQAQFSDVFDSFRHKDDKIALDDLDQNLQDTLQGIAAVNVFRPQEITIEADSTFPMLAKYRLEHLSLQNNSHDPMTVKVGTTPGGSEYGENEIAAGGSWDLDIGETFWANATIYIGGVNGELIVLIDRK